MLKYLKEKNIRIGILGGSFNPAHIGHLEISKIAKNKKKLKYVQWIITKKNPFKQKYKKSINNRIKYSKKITGQTKFIKVEFLETKIKSNKTIDLIKFIKKINSSAKIYFIMGADNLINFHKWHNWRKIPTLAKVVVFARPNFSIKALKSVASKKLSKKDWIYINSTKFNISSSKIKKI